MTMARGRASESVVTVLQTPLVGGKKHNATWGSPCRSDFVHVFVVPGTMQCSEDVGHAASVS